MSSKGFTPLEVQKKLNINLRTKAKPPFGFIPSITGRSGKSLTGFTIIELLVAIFILTVGIAAVLNIFPFGVQVQKSSQMATVAVQLSQARMEEIISKSYGEIFVETVEEDYGFNVNFDSYKRKTEISYFDPENPQIPASTDLGIKKIEVTVFWRSPLAIGEKEVRLATLIARR